MKHYSICILLWIFAILVMPIISANLIIVWANFVVYFSICIFLFLSFQYLGKLFVLGLMNSTQKKIKIEGSLRRND
jgi:hypothetical protein